MTQPTVRRYVPRGAARQIFHERGDEVLLAGLAKCAICLKVPSGNLHIDHDHSCCPTYKKSCGKCIRGLLCEDCNRAIGMMNDDPDTLIRAAVYLRG